ncbi:MAG: hypothetical protein COB36_09450 [Alphaproteobacteria bacterium]|nr:MAG: hypothetical protein COB36_09450 [Alphaproteobacteria bacterium]
MNWAIAAIALYSAGLSSLILRKTKGTLRGQAEIENQSTISLFLGAIVLPIFIVTAVWTFLNMPWYFAGGFILVSLIQPFSIIPINKLYRSSEVEFMFKIKAVANVASFIGCGFIWSGVI